MDEALRSALQAGPDCLPLEVLASRLDLPVESSLRRAAEGHLRDCAHCRTELALLNEFEAGAVRPEERETVEWIEARLAVESRRNAVRPVRWWRRSWTPPVFAGALAAAAALIVAINVEWRRPVIPADGPDVVRAAPLRAIAPLGDLKSIPQEFRWTAVPGAADYRLTVTEVDRTVVYQDRVIGASAPVPDQVKSLFQPAKTLFWSITAEDASGREIARTSPQLIRLQIPELK